MRFGLRLAQLTAASFREGASPPQPLPIALVRCRRCGVFVPGAQATSAASDSPDGPLCRACSDA